MAGIESDGYCIKCKNTWASAKPLYQQVNLTQGTYPVELLAFTDGSDISANEDIAPYAAEVIEGQPPGANAITTPSYTGYVLTHADTPQGDQQAFYLSGIFEVSQGEAGEWYVGAEVKGNKLGYIASVTCRSN